MLLDAIEAVNFRNLSGKIDCAAGINILFGDNGQGKTNWLEAINLLATGRSFRTQKLQETVKFGETLGIVRGIVSQTDSDIHRALQVSIQGNTKSLWVNGKREPISRYLTQLNCFTFTAADLEVVRGGPEARRNFIDHCALNLHPAYARTLSDLHRILKQKNSLLKSAADGSLPTARLASMLAPWNDQLVEVAAEIHATRTDIVRRLGEVLEKNLF